METNIYPAVLKVGVLLAILFSLLITMFGFRKGGQFAGMLLLVCSMGKVSEVYFGETGGVICAGVALMLTVIWVNSGKFFGHRFRKKALRE
jgi:hypothetical protein